MKTLVALVVLALTGQSPAAPRDESQGAAPPDITGSYQLVQVNGLDVPTTLSHDGVTITVRAGSFIIYADATCTSRTTFVLPSGQEMTRDVAGTFTRDGVKLTIRWTGAGITTGTADGKTFTMDNEGMVLTYRK